ncbi:NfeD family protein [Sporohalobacter salinus]|uniref:NfeD family protein n=1 Tax=Sporohalobacter salinus TaxID=1494606 RepID=UPI00195F491B|nr:nodulation protein NfeD [Sporohalobacter salinus]MBM7623150.1 membrane-bound serine protease (ClpP class) [Sporohalobacter salinus]
MVECLRINKRCLTLFLIVVMGLLFCFSAVGQTKEKIVYEIPIEGEINLGLARFVNRGINQAENSQADAVLLTVDTFGGLVKAATMIRDDILRSEVPIIAYVKNRAWSAGALITIASNDIFMDSGSSIGAAETRPKEEKYISAFRKEFETTAEKRGRDSNIAAAMVDDDIEIEGVVEKDKILTLTANEAKKLDFIIGVVDSKQDVIAAKGYSKAKIKKLTPNLREQLARFVSSPAISTILLTVGFIALMIEGITLGWGGSGTVGMLALGLYFGGRLMAGTAGVGLILLFIIGIFLLGLEVLVVPGFGLTGIGGIVAILISLFFTFESQQAAVYVLSISLLASVVGLIIAFKYFINSTIWNKIELGASQTKEEGYSSHQKSKELLGEKGRTVTPLRPAGIAKIAGKRRDVVSQGEFISDGEEIEVISVQGRRIVVKKFQVKE